MSNDNPNEDRDEPRKLGVIGTIFVAVGATMFVAGAVATFVYATEICLILFLAVLFGVFLTKCSQLAADKTGLGYGWSLAGVTTLVLLFGIGSLVLFGAQIEQQISRLSKNADEAREMLREQVRQRPALRSALTSIPFAGPALGLNEGDQGNSSDGGNGSTDDAQDGSSGHETENRSSSSSGTPKKGSGASGGGSTAQAVAKPVLSAIGGALKSTLGLVVNSMVIFFVGLFLAVNPTNYRDGIVRLFPESRRERTREILDDVGHTLWSWLLGRFGSMLVTGVGAALLLLALGVPMALTVGVITALLTFIPNIGGFIALMLAVLLAGSKGATVVVAVIVGYLLLQLVESYVVTPLIQKRQVELPPALLIAFQALMGVVFGFLGAAVASPMLAAGKVVVEKAYIEDVLER